MCLPDFSLKCHNGAAKAASPPIVCPPPMKVVQHREVSVAIHDGQVRPFWGVLVDGRFRACWVPLDGMNPGRIVGANAWPTLGGLGSPRSSCKP